MSFPYWEYNKKEKEITIYFNEYKYVTYYDEDADALYRDLQFGRKKDRQFILNELYLDYEHHDPYRRSDDLL